MTNTWAEYHTPLFKKDACGSFIITQDFAVKAEINQSLAAFITAKSQGHLHIAHGFTQSSSQLTQAWNACVFLAGQTSTLYGSCDTTHVAFICTAHTHCTATPKYCG